LKTTTREDVIPKYHKKYRSKIWITPIAQTIYHITGSEEDEVESLMSKIVVNVTEKKLVDA
jgi:hypothetical protein